MKTKSPSTQMDPAAAFPDRQRRPRNADLAATLGEFHIPLDQIFHRLRTTHPAVTTAWQYTEQSGWYQMHLLKKRRLLYLVPKRDNYRLVIILGRKAVASLQSGPLADRVNQRLATARHYPEGIMFTFTLESIDPPLITALLEAKLAV
jgi:hypothetical protein